MDIVFRVNWGMSELTVGEILYEINFVHYNRLHHLIRVLGFGRIF